MHLRQKKAGAVFVDLTTTFGLAMQYHMQAAETSTGQAHGSYDYGAYPEQML